MLCYNSLRCSIRLRNLHHQSVRHLREGVIDNHRSKPCMAVPVGRAGQTCYFPAYELVIDDLRVIVFRGLSSQLRPHNIFEKFKKHMNPETRSLMKEIAESIWLSETFNPSTTQHRHFLSSCTKARLLKNNPTDLENEISYLKSHFAERYFPVMINVSCRPNSISFMISFHGSTILSSLFTLDFQR